jgi:uncharacterized membrane protein
MPNRLKNYVLWVAISAFVLDVLIYANVITVTDKQEIEMLFQRFLELLTITGILNNPSKGKGLKDK